MWRAEDVAKEFQGYHNLSEHDLAYALRFLRYYGYLKAEDPTPETVAEAAGTFQGAYDLDRDGLLGQQTLEAMWAPRCGVRDDAFTLPARWRKRELRWWVDQYIDGIPGLSRSDQDDLQALSFHDFESVIDVKWTRAQSRQQADLIVGVGEGSRDQFDGPGGTLAWCQIPSGDERPIIMKFDRGDPWIKSADVGRRGILYGNVDKHEKGHAHGMLHISGEKALLNAFYAADVGMLLSADKKALLALGYPPAQAAPTPPTGSQTITITIQGKVTAASLPGFRVLPLI